MNTRLLLVLLALAPILAAAPTADRESLRSDVHRAITDGANYACDVLLGEEGASRCDYDILKGAWRPYEPAWHTGQIIFGLVEAYRITGNPRFLEQAKRAGNWWVNLEIEDPPELKGMVRAVHGAGIEYIVTATVSDGTNGLFNLWRATGDERYAAVPTRAGEWILHHLYVPEQGVLYDAVDPRTGAVMKERSPFWPKKTQQVLFDVARPNNEGYLFKDMYEYTKDERYKKVFLDLCDSLVEKQGPEGLWMDFTPNNRERGSFHPRFNLWYAESLIEGYEMTKNQAYLGAARKTLEFYTKFQRSDGAIFRDNSIDGSYEESSASGSTVSFAGLLWIRLVRAGVAGRFEDHIERSLQWVLKNRYPGDHPDRNLAGGFYNLRIGFKGKPVSIVQRDLGTSFGLRFLAAYYDYKFGDRPGLPSERLRARSAPDGLIHRGPEARSPASRRPIDALR